MDEVTVGSVIGGYRLKALIGQGGMGVVYLAESVQTGVNCALKLLTPELSRQAGFRERFVREARYANSLAHPNVIETYDAGEENGVLYMAMQYVEGRDLKGLLSSEGPLDPARAVGLLSQVASALDTAHATGLLHRDVKPGNIMIASGAGVEAAEHCYLTDFGLSKNVSSDSVALTAAGEFVGTIDYTPPELVLGKDADHRVDVYSLGCVLYECLTGQVPFPKERDVEVLYAHIQDPPPAVSAIRPDVPPGIDDVVARALAKDPNDRYASSTEFMDAARAVVGGPPVAAVAHMLTLHVLAGNAAGQQIPVEGELVIGRHAPTDSGKLGKDIEISRRHAEITRDAEGRYLITDLGSTNGTFVNGQRVAQPQVLQEGDTIEVGETTLRVQLAPVERASLVQPSPPPPPPPPPPAAAEPTPAPVPEEPTPAPVPDEPTPAPVPEEPAPAPVADEPTPAPVSEDRPPPPATVFAAVPEEVEVEGVSEAAPAAEPRRVALAIELTPEGELAIELDGQRFVQRDGGWSPD